MKSKRFFLACMVVFVVLLGLYKFSKFNLLRNETTLKVEVDKYVRAEMRETVLDSRRWMSHGMELAKHINFAPASASRFYSYIASVYYDVLEVSNEAEANLATAEIINILAPEEKTETQALLSSLTSFPSLSPASQKVLENYKKRVSEDRYDLVWDKVTPEDNNAWFIVDNKIDKGAKAGQWSTWLLKSDDILTTPPPPEPGSLLDKLEIEKVKYAVTNRRLEDINTIYFWHGSTGFEKGMNADNVTPAGVWQNILYTEIYPREKPTTNKQYAYAQKILAQTIADAFIECWKVKYDFWSQRPSMKTPGLGILVANPPFPSYVSGHSTISAAAATVLSALYPEKKDVWMDNLKDARNSRLMAGIHFDTDNKMGENLGKQIGKTIVEKVLKIPEASDVTLNPATSNNFIKNIWELGLLKFQPIVRKGVAKYLKIYHKYIDTPAFQNVLTDSGIKSVIPAAGASFADYDNDGDLDLYIAGRRNNRELGLFRNDNGKFLNVTKQSRLEKETGALVFSGIFGDYNNDGCLDLFLTGDPLYVDKSSNTWLYKNKCDGTFEDVTMQSGIVNKYHGRGSNWVDYDNDGDLDIYIANQGDYVETIRYTYEPNILFRNNGNGTFTNVTEAAGVDGLIGNICPATRINMEVLGKGFKASLQPIWFDFNNDNYSDLFVATDSGISSLYKNNGDGTFKNVTRDAGMCKYGTGMGVTAGDYDNDGDLDIYVTNVGGNYLWENQGNGTFIENAKATGLGDKTSLGWGTGFFDYDNDGHLDLYVVNGDVVSGNTTPEIGKVRIDRLYRNLGNKNFASVAESEGIVGDDPKEGATFGDYDGNGFEDLFVVTSRKEQLDAKGDFRFYKNLGNDNNWVTLKLIGTKSNKDAVGAKITLVAGGSTQTRQIISGSSYLSQNSLWQTFGLGKNEIIDSVKITWPSGITQDVTDLRINELNTVYEK